jgi:hypothetical protein
VVEKADVGRTQCGIFALQTERTKIRQRNPCVATYGWAESSHSNFRSGRLSWSVSKIKMFLQRLFLVLFDGAAGAKPGDNIHFSQDG